MDEPGATSLHDGDDDDTDFVTRKSNRERTMGSQNRRLKERDPERAHQRTRRRDEDETFRCRHCHTMVGPVVSGGRHRNHCPMCLYSLHVDGKTPGDRASACRSLMAPIGLFARPSGEQVIVHECLGCGFRRYNRVAADDNPLVVMHLELINPPFAETQSDEDDRLASQ